MRNDVKRHIRADQETHAFKAMLGVVHFFLSALY